MVLDVVNKFLSFKMWMWILIGLCFISKVQGFANRPFPQSCHSMLPEHRDRTNNLVNPQSSELPFEVHYELGNDGEPITVFLRSNNTTKFRGFLLEARKTGNLERSVGKFIILDSSTTQFQSCNGLPDSAVRQDNKLKKTSVRVNWTAEGAKLDITFRATFVESFWKFWRPVDAQVILPTQPSTSASTTTSTTKPTTTSTTKPSTTTSTTKPSTTSTTEPSTTTSTTKPSTTSTTEPSTTSTTEPSTTTSTTKPSTTTTTAPSTKSTTEPSTTKPGTTASSTEPSTTASTTKPSTSSTIKPGTAESTTKPSTIGTTKPSTAASTTKPSTIGTTKPSTAASTTKPSTSNTTKPSTTAPGPGPIPRIILQKAIPILTSVSCSFKQVEMELSNIVTIFNGHLQSPESKGFKIMCCVLCAAVEILAVNLVYMGDSHDVILAVLLFVVIVINFIDLVIVSLPFGPTHELKDSCDLAAKVCFVIHEIFAIAIIIIGVLKIDKCRHNMRESWLLKVTVAYAVWVFLFAIIWVFLSRTLKHTRLKRVKTESSNSGEEGKRMLSTEVTVIAVSIIVIAGTISFTVAVIVGISGCREE